MAWLCGNQHPCSDKLKKSTDNTVSILQKQDGSGLATAIREQMVCIEDLRPHIQSFDQEFTANATYAYWKQHMEMFQVLLQFIRRAEREGL